MISYHYLQKNFGKQKNAESFLATTNNCVYVFLSHRDPIEFYDVPLFINENFAYDSNGKRLKTLQNGSVESVGNKLYQLHSSSVIAQFYLPSDFVESIKELCREDTGAVTHIRFYTKEEKLSNEKQSSKRVFVRGFNYRSFLTDYVSVSYKHLNIYEERVPRTVADNDFTFTLKSHYFSKRMKTTTYEVSLLKNNCVIFSNEELKLLMRNQEITEPVCDVKVNQELTASILFSVSPKIDTLFN
jgi:hypothetical protein